MNFPTQLGFPQIVLLLVALTGAILLISCIKSIFFISKEIELLEDEYGRKYRHYRHHRRVRWHHGASGIILLLVSILFLLISFALQEYLGLTGKILVAHVRAVQVQDSGSIPMMSVELMLYDQNGSRTSDNTYILNGDEAFIGGDIIAVPGWENILGIHSGYKLTKLEGMYSDVNLEEHAQHTVKVLNGGDDDFFNTAYHKGWNTFFVTAAYKNGSSVPTNGIGYNICVSQDAIVPQPDNVSC